MANWLSMQSTAEKYGIPEEQIREWIRFDYVTYSSFFKRDPCDDPNPMVDTDELDKVLQSNSIQSCPDDETIERVPKGHLDWLYQENARLAKINDDLREEIYSHVQWEKELNDDFTKITELANKVISLHRQIIMDYEGLLNAKMGIRSFYVICFFLKRINTSPNQWISFFFNPFHLLNEGVSK